MDDIKISIFTPTYNREKLLLRVYNSLLNQTNKNFIWLVIDDGSTDNTKKLIKDLKEKADFQIEYYYQENGGKHRAHNTAVKKCKTDYFLILDSDDYLSNRAVEVLEQKIEEIDADSKVSGVIGNRFYANTHQVIGKKIPKLKYASGMELYQKYKFTGDTIRMYKTKNLREYLFPEIKNEKFILENVVFDKIDSEYKFMVIDDELYYGEYQEDGYTNNILKVYKKNPVGYAISLRTKYKYSITLKKKISYMILYMLWCKNAKINCEYDDNIEKCLYILLYPVAFLLNTIKYPKFFFDIFKN